MGMSKTVISEIAKSSAEKLAMTSESTLDDAAKKLWRGKIILAPNLSVPVSVKIRLLDSVEETIRYMQLMVKSGARAIGVHLRNKTERRDDPAHWEVLQRLIDSVRVPVLINGDIIDAKDIVDVRKMLRIGENVSIMIARGALKNCSIFRPLGEQLPLDSVIRSYLRHCIQLQNHPTNSKYNILQMLKYNGILGTPLGRQV